MYDLVLLFLRHIKHCWLFNAKFSLYIYIKYIWFGLVGFYGISTIVGYLMPNRLYTYILNMYDLVLLFLRHIKHCWLFNAKFSLYIYIKYIWFDLVGFYGISTIVGYLMPNRLYTYILNMYDLVLLLFKAFKHCWLFNAKFSLYIYIKYIWFGFVLFGLVLWHFNHWCYSMSNQLYMYRLNIYNLLLFGWVLWHINHCRLFNFKSFLYIYICG